MPLIDDFDSLDEEEVFEAQHPLGSLNSRLIANGMDGILLSGTDFCVIIDLMPTNAYADLIY